MKNPASKKKWIPACMATAGILFYLYYGVYKLLFVHLELLGGDYRNVYYWAVENYLHDHSAYVTTPGNLPFLYAPLSILVYVPFGHFSLNEAILLWLVASQAFLALSGFLLWRIGRHSHKIYSAVAAITAVCFSMPVITMLFAGNAGILLLAGLCMACHCLYFEKDKTMAVVIALMSYIKIFPALLMVVDVRHRSWKKLLNFAAVFLLLGLLSLGIFGIEEHNRYLRQLSDGMNYLSHTIYNASFAFMVMTFFPGIGKLSMIVTNAIWGMALLTLWWLVADRDKALGKSASVLTDTLILLVLALLAFPATGTMMNALLIIPFYFIILIRLQNNLRLDHFGVFIALFCLINFWDVMVHQVPIPFAGVTLKAIGDNHSEHPSLYPMLFALPFLFNLAFYVWLLINYRTIRLAIGRLRQYESPSLPVPSPRHRGNEEQHP